VASAVAASEWVAWASVPELESVPVSVPELASVPE
jgi:hypothetical protein